MTYDGSNRKQVRQKEKESAQASANRIAYTRQIMSTSFGRAWMHSLLESCYIFSEPFVRGAADATAHNLGRQAVGKGIFADIVAHCPSEYVLMTQEATTKELANERRNSDDRSTGSEHSGSTDPAGRNQGPVGEYDPYAVGDTGDEA